MKLTQKQYEVLRHTLTGGSGKEYRNRYCCGPGHDGYDACEQMVSAGLMWKREPCEVMPEPTFHATLQGVEAYRAANGGA